MAVIALVALVVIGPKDLPRAMRTVGHWVRKIRLVARDFQSNLDDMIRESELDEARKAVESTNAIRNPGKAIKDAIDPEGEIDKEAKSIQSDAAEAEREVKSAGKEDTAPKQTFSSSVPAGQPAASKPKPEPKPESKPEAKPEPKADEAGDSAVASGKPEADGASKKTA